LNPKEKSKGVRNNIVTTKE
jgi:hypothetical protein